MAQSPLVSIVLPCRNEARSIEAVLAAILAQKEPPGGLEVIVADGLSSDGTRERVLEAAKRDARIRLVDNPKCFTSHGLNAAIAAAGGEIIVRMDAHTIYAPDYVQCCVTTLRETGADNVGGAARTRAAGNIQRAIAAAYHSCFAVGGARFHDEHYEGYLDTVPYGCWPRATFEKYGLFDEELVRNQDDEHNLRIICGDGKVWQSSKIRSWYSPRDSILDLFRQYFQYGYWRVRVIQKHRLPASIRHVVPGAFVLILLACLAVSFLFPPAGWLGLGLAALYTVCLVAAALVTGAQSGWSLVPVLPAVFAAYHFGYGLGFVRGVLDFVVIKRRPRASATRLTRTH
jgi:glycosyltransferase involved in cell wall biosynthesis